VTRCSNSPRSSAPEEPRLDVEPRRHTKVLMPCVDPIDETDDLPEGYRSTLDVVALPETTTHQRGRFDPDSGFTFSKMGLLVRTGASFHIEVATRSLDNALIRWDNTGSIDPASPLRLQNCQGSRTWLVYPGGVWTIEPACVTLLVLTDTARPQPMCPAFQGRTEPSRVAPSPTTPFPRCRTLAGRPTRDPPTLSLSRQVGAAIGLPNPGGQTDEEVPCQLRRRLEQLVEPGAVER
jgi:hypothetical protein